MAAHASIDERVAGESDRFTDHHNRRSGKGRACHRLIVTIFAIQNDVDKGLVRTPGVIQLIVLSVVVNVNVTDALGSTDLRSAPPQAVASVTLSNSPGT